MSTFIFTLVRSLLVFLIGFGFCGLKANFLYTFSIILVIALPVILLLSIPGEFFINKKFNFIKNNTYANLMFEGMKLIALLIFVFTYFKDLIFKLHVLEVPIFTITIGIYFIITSIILNVYDFLKNK